MSNIIKGILTGMFCGTIFMIILAYLGYVEWGGVLLGFLIGKIVG